MGDKCPRINVSIPTESNSFKRSFDELALDLNNSIDRSEGSSVSGERNKRARGEHIARSPSPSQNSGSSSSATIPSRRTSESDEDGPPSTVQMSTEADNVYAPMEGVEPSPSIAGPSPRVSPLSEQRDHFRLSMERFNAFDSNIAVLRHSDSPIPGPSLPRAPHTPLAALDDLPPRTLEMPPTPTLNILGRSRPSSPASTSTLTSRLSAVPPALPALATVINPPEWYSDFDALMFGEASLHDILNPRDRAQSSVRVRNAPRPRESDIYGDHAHESRDQPHAPTFGEWISHERCSSCLTAPQRLSVDEYTPSVPKKLCEDCGTYNSRSRSTYKGRRLRWSCRLPVSTNQLGLLSMIVTPLQRARCLLS